MPLILQLCFRRRQIHPTIILTIGSRNRIKWCYWSDCAVFFNLSLLEGVSQFRSHLLGRGSTYLFQCLGPITFTSHQSYSSSCSHPCVNPTLGSKQVLTSVMQSGGCVGQVVYFFAYAPLAQHNKLRVAAVYVPFYHVWKPLIAFPGFRIWFGTSAAVDTSIAVSLLWQLRQMKSPFKSTRRFASLYR